MATSRPPRCRGESGTAIVEAAIATPVVFLLLFGVLEFGNLFFAYETVTNGTTAVARSAAIQGDDAAADYEIVQAAKKALSGVNKDRIVRMVIWDATPRSGCSGSQCQGPGSTVPAGCTVSSSTERCNVYTPGVHWDNSLTAAAFDCNPNPAPNYANSWCPTTRKTAQNPPTGCTVDCITPSYLGIMIEYRHDWITGLFGGSVTIKETKITRLEPQSLL